MCALCVCRRYTTILQKKWLIRNRTRDILSTSLQRRGLSVGSLGHALTFQSLANLALANNNYTDWRGARKPPPNHTVTVCCLGIVFQPSRQSTQPGVQSYQNAYAACFRSSPGSLRRPGAVIQKEQWCRFGSLEGHCLWPCHGPQTLPLQDTLG